MFKSKMGLTAGAEFPCVNAVTRTVEPLWQVAAVSGLGDTKS
jgi:hypothetical protein